MVNKFNSLSYVPLFVLFPELEYIIGQTGAINTEIKEDPRPTIRDKLFSDLADTNDW